MRGEDAAESQICFLVNETHRERKQSQVMKNRIRRKKWTRSCRKGSEERAAASPGQKDAGGKSALRLQLCNPNHRLLDQHSTKSEQLVSIFIGPSAC